MRDRKANGIDGLNIEPLWLLEKIPSAPGVVLQGAACELDLGKVVTRFRRLPGRMQFAKHPLPHLRSRGEGEGDGQDLFRFVHFRKQLQQTASQQFRLARTSGSLNEKGLAGLECLRAGAFVDRLQEQFSHRLHPLRRRQQRGHSRLCGRVRRGRNIGRSWGTA